MKSLLFVLFALSACKHTTLAPPSAILMAPEAPAATQAEAEPSYDIEVSCADISSTPNQTFTLDRLIGETVSVHLCSQAGAGYEWAEADVNEKHLDRKVWQFTAPPETQIIGGSAWRDAVYEIKKGSDTTVELVYRRQWEEGDAIASVSILIQTPEA